jgi:hypothetical protein
MAGRLLHKLSARRAETLTEPGRHSDGGGRYLTIEQGHHSRRAWVFMYRERGTGRRRELGLGAAKGPDRSGLTLAEARTRAGDARKLRSISRIRSMRDRLSVAPTKHSVPLPTPT